MRVYWEESDESTEVRRACKVCRVDLRQHQRLAADAFVLSPSGLAHHANEYGGTDCGKDATRDGWWWPC